MATKMLMTSPGIEFGRSLLINIYRVPISVVILNSKSVSNLPNWSSELIFFIYCFLWLLDFFVIFFNRNSGLT